MTKRGFILALSSAFVAVLAVHYAHVHSASRAEGALRNEWLLLCLLALTAFHLLARAREVRHFEGRRERLEQELTRAKQELFLVSQRTGLFVLDARGRLSGEVAPHLQTWFGPARPGEALADYISRSSDAVGYELANQWPSAGELNQRSLERLPTRVHTKQRVLELGYSLASTSGAEPRVLVTVDDVSSHMAVARSEARRALVQRALACFASDKVGFVEFFHEADRIVRAITSHALAWQTQRAESTKRAELTMHTEDPAQLQALARDVHTLEGMSWAMELSGLVSACSALETELESAEPSRASARCAELAELWSELRTDIAGLVAGASSGEEGAAQYERLLELDAAAGPDAFARVLASWQFEPTLSRLARIAKHAKGIAARTHKGTIEFRVEDNGLRLDAKRWAPFWSALLHVVRNAIEHGIEPAKTRPSLGKAAAGRILLCTRVEATEFVIEVEDDGRGVDWRAIVKKASERGLPARTRDDLVEALFTEGVSTSEQVTLASGRGLGLAAARAACRELGGRVEVLTHGGEGTRVAFHFPRSMVWEPAHQQRADVSGPRAALAG